MQIKVKAKKHQICLAHLMRELKGFIEGHKEKEWSPKLNVLFFRSMKNERARVHVQRESQGVRTKTGFHSMTNKYSFHQETSSICKEMEEKSFFHFYVFISQRSASRQ